MEYVYAAMLLHKAGHKVDETSVKKVLVAAGVNADDGRVRALIAALDGVNIDDAIKNAAVMTASVAAPVHAEHKTESKKEEKKEDKQSEEQSAAGLSALFG